MNNSKGLRNIALRFVGFAFFGCDGNTFEMGASNDGCAGRLSYIANGDSYVSLSAIASAASASAVPGGGGLFVSNGATFSAVLCGILNPFSDTKYSPDLTIQNQIKIHFCYRSY